MTENFRKAKNEQEALSILGLDPNKKIIPIEDIKSAYRKIVLECHPDRVGNDPDKIRKFYEATYAYKYLTNPHFKYTETKQDKFLDVVINHLISFDEAFFGTKLAFNTNFEKPCPESKTNMDKEDEIRYSVSIDPFFLKIPAGTVARDFVFKNKGLKEDNLRGNVIVRVTSKEHQFYRIQGMDIVMDAELPLDKMIAGGNAYYCFCSQEKLAAKRQSFISEKGAGDYEYDRECYYLEKDKIEYGL